MSDTNPTNEDVVIFLAHDDAATLSYMTTFISHGNHPDDPRPNTIATGTGTYGPDDPPEPTTVLLFTDLTPDQADEVQGNADYIAGTNGQEAIGFFRVPTGSALLFTTHGQTRSTR